MSSFQNIGSTMLDTCIVESRRKEDATHLRDAIPQGLALLRGQKNSDDTSSRRSSARSLDAGAARRAEGPHPPRAWARVARSRAVARPCAAPVLSNAFAEDCDRAQSDRVTPRDLRNHSHTQEDPASRRRPQPPCWRRDRLPPLRRKSREWTERRRERRGI